MMANFSRKIANRRREYYADALANHEETSTAYLQEAADWAAKAKAYLKERDRD